jgi:hypothetical protein
MEIISFILEFIRLDIFGGYASFSILLIVSSFFTNNKRLLVQASQTSNSLLKISGLIYFVLFVTLMVIGFKTAATAYDLYCWYNRITGPYWWAYWLSPVLWLIVTQLLWSKKVAASKAMRILISLIMIFDIEKFVIFMTSFHRDYLPSSWTMVSRSQWMIIYDSIEGVIVFSIFCWIYYFISERIKTLTNPVTS